MFTETYSKANHEAYEEETEKSNRDQAWYSIRPPDGVSGIYLNGFPISKVSSGYGITWSP